MSVSSLSDQWSAAKTPDELSVGVSLHGHTSHSCETLDFLACADLQRGFAETAVARMERWAEQHYGLKLEYAKSFWRPPASPMMAYDLEADQIRRLGLDAMVSLTDHDNIEAPLLLHTMPALSKIPISVEWSIPYKGGQGFHLGIHNLPVNRAKRWMEAFAEETAHPSEKLVRELLSELNRERDVLIVLNHPQWDLFQVGTQQHEYLLGDFLQKNGGFIHTLELNGLRPWSENRSVIKLAEQWNMTLISGGDRHGLEPNAVINLTRATSFAEFVHEVRVRRLSHIRWMPQYAKPWKQRILKSVLDTVRNDASFPEGARRWDERVFFPDRSGVIRTLASYWKGDLPPWPVRMFFAAIQHLDCAAVERGASLLQGKEESYALIPSEMEG